MRKGNKRNVPPGKSAKGKGVVVTAAQHPGEADRVFVGLDVHKRQIHAAVRVNGQEVGTHVLPARPAALAFETEMYRPERFSNERQVSAMLGLAPQMRQSGERRREGPLLKAGHGRLRTLLVEAAWVSPPTRPGGPEGVPAIGAEHRLATEGDRRDGAASGVGLVAWTRKGAGGGLNRRRREATRITTGR
jgi:hypothetical protein